MAKVIHPNICNNDDGLNVAFLKRRVWSDQCNDHNICTAFGWDFGNRVLQGYHISYHFQPCGLTIVTQMCLRVLTGHVNQKWHCRLHSRCFIFTRQLQHAISVNISSFAAKKAIRYQYS